MRAGQWHDHWACWEPLEGGWQGGAGARWAQAGAQTQVGIYGQGAWAGRWARPVMGAGQARQAWPTGQVRRRGSWGAEGSTFLGPSEGTRQAPCSLRRMPTARTLTAKCEEGRRPGRGVPGRDSCGARRVAPACDRRASGAGGRAGPSCFRAQLEREALLRLLKVGSGRKTASRAIGVGGGTTSRRPGLGTLGAGAPFSAPSAWGPPSPGVSEASWLLPRAPEPPDGAASASSQPGSQEGPTLPPGRPAHAGQRLQQPLCNAPTLEAGVQACPPVPGPRRTEGASASPGWIGKSLQRPLCRSPGPSRAPSPAPAPPPG